MSKLIILEVVERPKPNVRVCYWLDVPAAHQPMVAALQADAVDLPWQSAFVGATVGETTALTDGEVKEIVLNHEFDIGTSLTTMKSLIVAEGTRLAGEVDDGDQYAFYGTYYDTQWNDPGT